MLDMAMLSKVDALKAIEAARAGGKRVVGVEGFERKGAGYVPRMDQIGDFSESDVVETCARAARDMIEEADATLLWELVVE